MGDSGGKQLHAGITGIVLESLEPQSQQSEAILSQLQCKEWAVQIRTQHVKIVYEVWLTFKTLSGCRSFLIIKPEREGIAGMVYTLDQHIV